MACKKAAGLLFHARCFKYLMHSQQIKKFFSILSKKIKKPKSDLKYTSHFTLLIAVILSAQATDKSVNNVTKILFKIANTPKKFKKLGENKIRSYIKSIGLYKNKAKNICNLSKILIEKYNGVVPNKFDDLITLPGVGRKTANVILNVAFDQNTIGVDTHIFRVSNRTLIAPGKTVEKVEQNLMKVVPKQFLRIAHHLLILHGRYTCKARNPLCGKCVVFENCNFKDKTKYA